MIRRDVYMNQLHRLRDKNIIKVVRITAIKLWFSAEGSLSPAKTVKINERFI